MRVALIYATWPVTPFGIGWFRQAEAMRAAGVGDMLRASGHQVEEYELTATGPAAAEVRGAFELGAAVAARCKAALAAGAFPIIVCGSCGVSALGAMAGLDGGRTGVLWMDAHPDLNTPETSGSGLFDGMALAAALGACWAQMGRQIAGLSLASAADVCLFGARDIDPGEAAFIAEHRIAQASDAQDATRHLASASRVYIHLDMDVHDGAALRVSGASVPGGVAPDSLRTTLAEVAGALPVAALAITGIDPAVADAGAIPVAIGHIEAVLANRKP